jgi:hypothetical protein
MPQIVPLGSWCTGMQHPGLGIDLPPRFSSEVKERVELYVVEKTNTMYRFAETCRGQRIE